MPTESASAFGRRGFLVALAGAGLAWLTLRRAAVPAVSFPTSAQTAPMLSVQAEQMWLKTEALLGSGRALDFAVLVADLLPFDSLDLGELMQADCLDAQCGALSVSLDSGERTVENYLETLDALEQSCGSPWRLLLDKQRTAELSKYFEASRLALAEGRLDQERSNDDPAELGFTLAELRDEFEQVLWEFPPMSAWLKAKASTEALA